MDKETAIELEHLVEGIEEAFAILSSAIAEETDAAALVKHMLQASQGMNAIRPENGWRERLLRKMLIPIAQRARRQNPDNIDVQTLTAALLTAAPDEPTLN